MFQGLECGHGGKAIIFPTTHRIKKFDVIIMLDFCAQIAVPKRYIYVKCLETGTVTYVKERIFADVKTRILRRGDHPGLSELCLNPMDVYL